MCAFRKGRNSSSFLYYYGSTLPTTQTAEQIKYYVANYKPFDKAGAYAIQEWIGMVGIEKINGDYYSVMGLPIGEVVLALRAF